MFRLSNFSLQSATWSCVLACALVVGVTGCKSEPYCISNCGEDAGLDEGRDVLLNPIEAGNLRDARDSASDARDGANPTDGCVVGSMELCNGLDDNCDGRTDEGIDTTTDPRNCGGCGRACNLPRAIPSCQNSRCVIPPNGCDTNFFDLDMNPDNGCEYACTPVPGATNDMTCNNRDDNCNGTRDEDVNLCTDVNNCGGCGRVCVLPHVRNYACVRTDGMTTGACTAANTACRPATTNGCEPNFYDLDNNPMNGCEYACTPSTPPTETCDGRDNNCNGMIDEGNPGGGQTCGTAEGECRTGTTRCSMGRTVCDNEITPSPETCNGRDDDCNGVTDNAVNQTDTRVGGPCGMTRGECRAGTNACVNGALVCMNAVNSVPETCNGRDDDCDGNVDNGIASGGACGMTRGQCRAGTLQCSGGTMVCTGAVGQTLETCNQLDDDCDGSTDEDFDKQNDPNNCGVCGRTCTAISNAVTGCMGGNCVLRQCAPGFYNLDRIDSNGCEYACQFTGAAEVCNGLDDDCDGSTDEARSASEPLGVLAPSGFCRSTGPCNGATVSCQGTRGFVCNYPSTVDVDPMTGQPAPVETRCDTLDNNCNGLTDESFTQLGQSCASQAGCAPIGRFVCNGTGNGVSCNAPGSSAELCDGIDNDCDGTTDDSALARGTNATFYVNDTTEWSAIRGSGATTLWMMKWEASRPGATRAAAGTATNRACSAMGVQPWVNLTAVQAQAACAAMGPGVGLCAESDWELACQITASAAANPPSPTCLWSYGTGCRSYVSGLCNDVNNDIIPGGAVDNGLIPTGDLGNCFAARTNANVFDLSGNAREFVAPRSAGINPVRGGSYNNLAHGTQCHFDWTVVDNTFAFVNTGFRCCYQGANPP